MAPDILIRAGNTVPVLRRTLEIDGSPVDLTGVTSVTFKASGRSGVVISGACAVVSASEGVVDYDWSAQDALVAAGFYQAWYEVAFGSDVLTVPNATYLVLQISSVAQGAWSYSGDPSLTPRDTVRFYLQDTNSDDPQMADAELDFLISDWYPVTASYINVAAVAADTLSTRYAAEVSVSADSAIVALEQLQDKWAAAATRLRALAARKDIAGPDVGGIDRYDEPDPNEKPKSFAKGMHDSRYAGQQDYGDEISTPVSPLYGDPGGWW